MYIPRQLDVGSQGEWKRVQGWWALRMAQSLAPPSSGRTGRALSWKPGPPGLPYSIQDRSFCIRCSSAEPPVGCPYGHHCFQRKNSRERREGRKGVSILSLPHRNYLLVCRYTQNDHLKWISHTHVQAVTHPKASIFKSLTDRPGGSTGIWMPLAREVRRLSSSLRCCTNSLYIPSACSRS